MCRWKRCGNNVAVGTIFSMLTSPTPVCANHRDQLVKKKSGDKFTYWYRSFDGSHKINFTKE